MNLFLLRSCTRLSAAVPALGEEFRVRNLEVCQAGSHPHWWGRVRDQTLRCYPQREGSPVRNQEASQARDETRSFPQSHCNRQPWEESSFLRSGIDNVLLCDSMILSMNSFLLRSCPSPRLSAAAPALVLGEVQFRVRNLEV